MFALGKLQVMLDLDCNDSVQGTKELAESWRSLALCMLEQGRFLE